MIDNIKKLAEFNEIFIDLNKKFMTYDVIIAVFKSKAQKALDDGDTNEAQVYVDVLGFCVNKQGELLHELKELNKKVTNL